MIGPRIGAAVGARLGTRVGSPRPAVSGALADQDGPDSVYVPSSAAQFTALGLTAPTSLWLMQEASGNLADSIGANTLTAFGTAQYSQAVTGWTRTAIGFADNSTASFFNVSIANPTTTSLLLLTYVKIRAAPAATRDTWAFGTSTGLRRCQVTTTPAYQVVGGGGQATGTGAENAGTADVRPVVFQVDRTAGTIKVYTDQEVVAPAYTAPSGGGAQLQMGDTGARAPNMANLYTAFYSGAAAEMSTAQIKTMLETLGWTIPWS